ncbi:hypothetical protein B9J78_06430 [bacterium Unc6]|nr:hypothetical protein [bacterium Unc6]
MIDKDRIAAYISEIKTSMDTLNAYKEIDKQTFLASPIIVRDTKYCFIIAGQAAIDICYHLTAKLFKKAPTAYGNCFELLEESGFFSQDIIAKMSVMAKFRNLLVHHYVKVDNEQVYEKLSEIDCFEKFCDELNNLLKK